MHKMILLIAALLSTPVIASAQASLQARATEELRRIGCLGTGEAATGLRLRSAARCAQKAVGAAPTGALTENLVAAMRRLPNGAGEDRNQVRTPQAPGQAMPAPAPVAAPVGGIEASAELPPPVPEAELSRNMKIARDAWKKIEGFSEQTQPDRLVIRDFMPVPLSDGTAVVLGFGLRVREINGPPEGPPVPLLEIVDIQEFSPAWSLQGGANIKIGGYIFGDLFSLDQALRTALSRSGAKKLREGFSVQLVTATPYRNHKNEPRVQRVTMRLLVDPMVRPRGAWLVAQASEQPGVSNREDEFNAFVADFRARLDQDPCAVSNREMLALEREFELLRMAAGEGAADANLRQERDIACAIATNGAYALEDLTRLAVLREASCEDLAGGVSPALQSRANAMQREVAPPQYLQFARIGIYGLRDPSRLRLDAEEGAARKACILDYLEAELLERR